MTALLYVIHYAIHFLNYPSVYPAIHPSIIPTTFRHKSRGDFLNKNLKNEVFVQISTNLFLILLLFKKPILNMTLPNLSVMTRFIIFFILFYLNVFNYHYYNWILALSLTYLYIYVDKQLHKMDGHKTW